jgi:small subunit ribosomal protein S11
VNGITKRLPFISGGVVTASQELLGTSATSQATAATARVAGADVTSLGCGGRNHGRDVRVKGPGSGRESAIRALQTVGLDLAQEADMARVHA